MRIVEFQSFSARIATVARILWIAPGSNLGLDACHQTSETDVQEDLSCLSSKDHFPRRKQKTIARDANRRIPVLLSSNCYCCSDTLDRTRKQLGLGCLPSDFRTSETDVQEDLSCVSSKDHFPRRKQKTIARDANRRIPVLLSSNCYCCSDTLDPSRSQLILATSQETVLRQRDDLRAQTCRSA